MDWNFNHMNNLNFDDHIYNSIPGKFDIDNLIVKYIEYFAYENSTIIDIGSSSGKLLNNINQTYLSRNLKLIGIDNNENMKGDNYKHKNIKFLNNDFSLYIAIK